MSLDRQQMVADFCEKYDALMKSKGYPQLLIMATGGGLRISEIAVYPGSSSRIAAILHPYDMHELWSLVEPVVKEKNPDAKFEDWRSVHAESAAIYLEGLKRQNKRDLFFVASTAALETTRRRKGKNVSYVATQAGRSAPVRVWEILLRKREEEPVYRSHRGPDGSTVTTSPTTDERWNEIFMRNGAIDMHMLALCRICQDAHIARCLMQIIVDDPDFYPCLVDNERITLLSEDGKPVNKVWLEGRCDR